MDNLKKCYEQLVENPYEIFMIRSDGQIAEKEQLLNMANEDLGEKFPSQELHIFPGSFNPLHFGHRIIFNQIFSFKKVFEISLSRIGKPNLSLEELKQRLDQFTWYAPVVVTDAPRFIEKCSVFLNSGIKNFTFHIGVDTIQRMRDDYGEVGIRGLPARFSVYDRDMGNGILKYPTSEFRHKISNVSRNPSQPPDEFLGYSSTKIRNSKK
jgi:hypothetical protein